MGKKISQEIIDQIPILYSQLKSREKVAQQLGISSATVSRYLREQNEKLLKKSEITNEIAQNINDVFSKNKSLAITARKIGTSIAVVKDFLTEENLKIVKKNYEDRDALWYYMVRLFGVYSEESPVNPSNIFIMERNRKEGMPYAGQLLALKYFYEVQKNPIREDKKTLGIVKWIWQDAAAYYNRQAKRQKEIEQMIQEQLEKDRIEIKYKPSYSTKKNKRKKEIDLNSI